MKISFSGDFCVNAPIRQFQIAPEIECVFSRCNYNIACLEAPICNSYLPPFSKVGPTLRQCDDVDKFLNIFSHLSLANNHIMDYGVSGLTETLHHLRNHKIVAIGAGTQYPDMYQPVILESNGLKVALFCWAEAQYGCCKTADRPAGYAWLLNPRSYALIQEYKKKVDYVILFLHAGLEDVSIPLLDWRRQFYSFIDYGADLIVASHPHIIQGKECYNGKYIYYSLGNFFFNGEFATQSNDWTHSILLECTLSKENINFQEHFIRFSDFGIGLAKESSSDIFEHLSSLLTQEHYAEYLSLYNEIILKAWEDIYKPLYSFPILKPKPGISFYRRWVNSVLKDYVKRCFYQPVSENTIYHNISVDTHRFVVSQACSLIAGTY